MIDHSVLLPFLLFYTQNQTKWLLIYLFRFRLLLYQRHGHALCTCSNFLSRTIPWASSKWYEVILIGFQIRCDPNPSFFSFFETHYITLAFRSDIKCLDEQTPLKLIKEKKIQCGCKRLQRDVNFTIGKYTLAQDELWQRM